MYRKGVENPGIKFSQKAAITDCRLLHIRNYHVEVAKKTDSGCSVPVRSACRRFTILGIAAYSVCL